jgi:hypothetical protein
MQNTGLVANVNDIVIDFNEILIENQAQFLLSSPQESLLLRVCK